MKIQQVRTTLRITQVTRKGKTNRKLPPAHSHVSKNSTDQDPPEGKLSGPHLANNTLVNNTGDTHFNDVRLATHGTGCFPLDSLCIGHLTTINLERETSSTEDSLSNQQNTCNRSRKNSWSDWSRARKILGQVNKPLNIHIASRTEEDENNRVYNISFHQDKRYLNTS